MSFFASSSHWYRIDDAGVIHPCHDFDLRKARKVKAFPSITTILKERANPMLETWKQNQIFDAVTNNPRTETETEEDYKKRIVELSAKKGSDAADFGTRLHDALDSFPQMTIDSELRPYIDAFAPSYQKMVKHRICSEIMLADPELGVAGRTDLVAETYEYGPSIIDYKTSKFKRGKPSFWDSHRIQLSFYAKTYQKMMGLREPPVIINCGLNSEEPTEPVWKVWTPKEQADGYAEFLAIAFLWFASKDYWPVCKDRWIANFMVNGKLHSA